MFWERLFGKKDEEKKRIVESSGLAQLSMSSSSQPSREPDRPLPSSIPDIADQITDTPAGTDRVIRVFISSTFRDMMKERDYLVKFTFPQLRKLCESRGVTWGEVDLRWGVTDEQAAEGKVLPICLEEIKRCRPYFIGLLGERYGWVPENIPGELLENEPWLKGRFEKRTSVTELEILHGVLNDKKMANHAFFYFRSPAFIDSLPARERSAFREVPSNDEIAAYGAEGANQRAEERKGKLAALKDLIRVSGFPVHEDYPDERTLGDLVFQDLMEVINRLYPEDSQPNPLDRDAADHEAFAQSRARVYIGRQADFDQIDAFARGDGPPLVVLGESGAGKSALLANWARRYRQSLTEAAPSLVLMHFIGATSYGSDWTAMVRRIMGELKRRLGIQADIPDQPNELRAAFGSWLGLAAARSRVVLILDGLNQLEDRDQAPDLAWLPTNIPANIRLILSTLPGRALDALTKRGWPAFEVKTLVLSERRQLIGAYLAEHTKSLSPIRIERITAAKQTANPLYLRTLLEELRLFGTHERLDDRISHYLSADTIERLFQKVLERYEEDYEQDCPGLVRAAMSLLWAARRGLSEAELLDMLGAKDKPLSRAHWSPLYLAAETSFVKHSGLIGFSHDYLRQGVERRYLPTERARLAAHVQLADYFDKRELGPRRVDEEPWQLARALEWRRLYSLLADLPFVQAAAATNLYDVRSYWAGVEENTSLKIVAAYKPVLTKPEKYGNYFFVVSELLWHLGNPTEALSLYIQLERHSRKSGNQASLALALYKEAQILSGKNEPGQAMVKLEEAEALFRDLCDNRTLRAALLARANIHKAQGDQNAAMKLYIKHEELCRGEEDQYGLSLSLCNQALIYRDRGDYGASLRLLKEAGVLCRELGEKDQLSNVLNQQALNLRNQGDLSGALVLHQEDEIICRELGNKNYLINSLVNQGNLLCIQGDNAGGLKLFKEAELQCVAFEDRTRIQQVIGSQAKALRDMGDFDKAMEILREAEHISRKLEHNESLQAALMDQGDTLKEQGNLREALKTYGASEGICRKMNNKAHVAVALRKQAEILGPLGDLDGAMRLLKETARLAGELHDKRILEASLTNQATILGIQGDLFGALKLLEKSEPICREAADKDGLQTVLNNMGNALKGLGKVEGAVTKYKECESLCREIGNKHGLQRVLQNKGLLQTQLGYPNEAMAAFKEQESLCREIRDRQGLMDSIHNQAVIFQNQGAVLEAIRLRKEEELLCRELGNKVGLQKSLCEQGILSHRVHDANGAMNLYKESEQLCRETGDKETLVTLLINMAVILAFDQGQPQKALPLAEEAYRLADPLGMASARMKQDLEKMRVMAR